MPKYSCKLFLLESHTLGAGDIQQSVKGERQKDVCVCVSSGPLDEQLSVDMKTKSHCSLLLCLLHNKPAKPPPYWIFPLSAVFIFMTDVCCLMQSVNTPTCRKTQTHHIRLVSLWGSSIYPSTRLHLNVLCSLIYQIYGLMNLQHSYKACAVNSAVVFPQLCFYYHLAFRKVHGEFVNLLFVSFPLISHSKSRILLFVCFLSGTFSDIWADS